VNVSQFCPTRPITFWKLAITFWIWNAQRVPECGTGRKDLAEEGLSETSRSGGANKTAHPSLAASNHFYNPYPSRSLRVTT